MFHTATIKHSFYSNRYTSELDNIFTALGFNQQQRNRFQDDKTISKSLSTTGLSKISFHKNELPDFEQGDTVSKGAAQINIYLKIEPQALLEHQKTINLFAANVENITRLIAAFRQAILDLFGDQHYQLADLKNWSCYRLDISHNFYLGNSELAQDLIDLLKRTRIMPHHKPIDKEKSKNYSCYNINKSSRVDVYNKEQHIQDKFNNIDGDERHRLLTLAEGVARLELQMSKAKLNRLKDKYGLSDTSFLAFLDERIATEQLAGYWRQLIGFGNIYVKHHAEKTIEQSVYTTKTKDKLTEVLRLIAKKRSVAKVRAEFADDHCQKTFNGYLKRLATLGIAPITIPKDWSANKPYIKQALNNKGEYIPNPTPKEWREIVGKKQVKSKIYG